MGKALQRTILSIVTVLGINIIPAGIVFIGGQSAETAMILYFLENIISVILTVVRVRILAPAQDQAYAKIASSNTEFRKNGRIVFSKFTIGDRHALIMNFLMASFGLSIGAGIFLSFFLFLIMKAKISGSVVLSGIIGIAAFQVFSFVVDLFLLGRLSPEQAIILTNQSLGRVALIYFAVFIGVFLASMSTQWFVLPFIVLKTTGDLVTPVQSMLTHIQTSRLERKI